MPSAIRLAKSGLWELVFCGFRGLSRLERSMYRRGLPFYIVLGKCKARLLEVAFAWKPTVTSSRGAAMRLAKTCRASCRAPSRGLSPPLPRDLIAPTGPRWPGALSAMSPGCSERGAHRETGGATVESASKQVRLAIFRQVWGASRRFGPLRSWTS